MRQYTYGYNIETWTEYEYDGENLKSMKIISNLNKLYIRIFSNRGRISFLIGEQPNSNNDDDIKDEGDSNDTFSLRYTKTDGWSIKMNDVQSLTDISNSFNSNIEVIPGDENINKLEENQFMYGNGDIRENYGKVYGNGKIVFYNYDSGNYGEIYGNGDVEYNNSSGFVYGNGDVKYNYGWVYGNGDVTYIYSGEVYGNGNVNDNSNFVYGNGNVTYNYGEVYGNGNVNDNRVFVYGNGNVDNNNGTIYGGTEYGYDEIIDPEDNVIGNGKTIIVNDEGISCVINEDETYSESTLLGNTIKTSKNTKFGIPNTIVNSSLINSSTHHLL